jgi:cell division septum initiation protein DivIVA
MTSPDDRPASRHSVLAVLDELTSVVDSARPMPLSSSCLVNREQLLGLVDALRAGVPVELAHASELEAEARDDLERARSASDQLVADARAEADLMVAEARERARREASRDAITAEARRQADEILREARDQARTLRRDAGTYALSSLEDVAQTLDDLRSQALRGRDVLHEKLNEAEPRPDEATPNRTRQERQR